MNLFIRRQFHCLRFFIFEMFAKILLSISSPRLFSSLYFLSTRTLMLPSILHRLFYYAGATTYSFGYRASHHLPHSAAASFLLTRDTHAFGQCRIPSSRPMEFLPTMTHKVIIDHDGTYLESRCNLMPFASIFRPD